MIREGSYGLPKFLFIIGHHPRPPRFVLHISTRTLIKLEERTPTCQGAKRKETICQVGRFWRMTPSQLFGQIVRSIWPKSLHLNDCHGIRQESVLLLKNPVSKLMDAKIRCLCTPCRARLMLVDYQNQYATSARRIKFFFFLFCLMTDSHRFVFPSLFRSHWNIKFGWTAWKWRAIWFHLSWVLINL